MDIAQFRQSLKAQWLTYYRENRQWLTRVGVWVTCEGQRRPSSSFILATLSVLEPQLTQLLPLIADLSSNPDRIIIALGLNFNPDKELDAQASLEEDTSESSVRMLPPSQDLKLSGGRSMARLATLVDESCQGARNDAELRSRDQ